jgi:ssDNA-binding replication factor A large subunit
MDQLAFPDQQPEGEGDKFGSSDADQYMPISALNSFSMDWRIKARVVKKPPIRTYKNAKGEGQILTVDLIDREGTMI